MRIRLTLEYDGTDFAGFQLQGKGERTVQETLEEAIQQITGTLCRVHGAGRTDTGVHATGQIAHFDTDWTVPVERISFALNSMLPRDLVVKEASIAEPGFHSRFDATARIYRYTILNRKVPSALLAKYALHHRDALDLEAMRAAARELTGSHDFATFGKPVAQGRSTIRRVYNIVIRRQKDCVLVTVRGNAFLRQMVRAFIGTLLLAGQGRLTAKDVRRIREKTDRTCCPNIAPAHGLCLVRVEYNGGRSRHVCENLFSHETIELNRSIENLQDTDHEDLFGEAE